MTRFGVLTLISAALFLPACSSDVETDPGGTGGSDTAATGGEGGDASDGDGGAGGGACDPYDQACNCAGCEGTCIQACNFGPGWECLEPGAPAEGERDCGGFANCAGDEVCIHVEPQGDGCIDYFCAELPVDCGADRTCACLARFTDDHPHRTECTEEGGLEVLFYGYAGSPPWDQPACGLATCGEGESCWSCHVDGGGPDGPGNATCDDLNPSAPGIQTCSEVWTAD